MIFCLRLQVTKLAQVYKLRYRFNKTRAQSSTTYLIKARYVYTVILIPFHNRLSNILIDRQQCQHLEK